MLPNQNLQHITQPSQVTPFHSKQARSKEARDFVLREPVHKLASLGAGELSRIAHIISLDSNPNTQITHQYRTRATNPTSCQRTTFSQQDLKLEEKLQKAFIRAQNSQLKPQGAHILDKIISEIYFSTNENATLDEYEKLSACQYIFQTKGEDLNGLSKNELNQILKRLLPCYPLPTNQYPWHQQLAFQIIGTKFAAVNSNEVSRRTKIITFPVERENISHIRHLTSLFAQINRQLVNYLDQLITILPTEIINQHQKHICYICMQHTFNHSPPSELKFNLMSYLQGIRLPLSVLNGISNHIDQIAAAYTPSNNIGTSVDSPYAKKLENKFSAFYFESPATSMKQLGKKILSQLKLFAQTYQYLLQSYAQHKRHAIYQVCGIEEMKPNEVVKKIENMDNLALFMDFHFYCSSHFQNSDFINSLNNGEIRHTWYDKSYLQGVSQIRGSRIALPKLPCAKDKNMRIGVGFSEDTIDIPNRKIPFIRSCTVKTSFSSQSGLATLADSAQACGVSGCANVHFWGQALINQNTPLNLSMTENETRLFIIMSSIVMTADGGHTLCDILPAAKIASQYAKEMSQSSRGYVDHLFNHIRSITHMMNINDLSQFRHYDILFRKLNDIEINNALMNAWIWTIQDNPKNEYSRAS